jgi:hypothetical protein
MVYAESLPMNVRDLNLCSQGHGISEILSCDVVRKRHSQLLEHHLRGVLFSTSSEQS